MRRILSALILVESSRTGWGEGGRRGGRKEGREEGGEGGGGEGGGGEGRVGVKTLNHASQTGV